MPQERIPATNDDELKLLFGPMDRHLRAIRERYGVRITSRKGMLMIEGRDDDAVRDVGRRVKKTLSRIRNERGRLEPEVVESMLVDDAEKGRLAGVANVGDQAKPTPPPRPPRTPRRPIETPPGLPRPLTPNQERYVAAIRRRDVVFSIGPAGTGKTYLAVAEAVAALRSEEVRKLILTRPAVEAGEKLGVLPGDVQAKINPYLRPLYDALGEFRPPGEVKRCLDHDVIEIVPFAYMRGRTRKNAFIILDEAQNTTPAQMKMFLTRMGGGSKMVVNGDITQVDLPDDTPSGLVEAIRILEGVKGIDVVRLLQSDILRHPLVQKIVDAYERHEERRFGAAEEGAAADGAADVTDEADA